MTSEWLGPDIIPSMRHLGRSLVRSAGVLTTYYRFIKSFPINTKETKGKNYFIFMVLRVKVLQLVSSLGYKLGADHM